MHMCAHVSIQPSIQKLVNALAKDCLVHLSEESVHTDAYSLATPRVRDALRDLATEFTPSFVDQAVLAEAVAKRGVRLEKRDVIYNQIVSPARVISALQIDLLLDFINYRSCFEAPHTCKCV
jgi:proteasome activator subunit 4